mgnify:CR=1 FL=1
MVSQAGGDGRGALRPVNAVIGKPDRKAEAVMRGAEIVNTTDQKHARLQGVDLASQSASSANQASQTLAEGCVEPLDESGVDGAGHLAYDNQALDQFRAALNDAPLDRQYALNASLDHLHNSDFLPNLSLIHISEPTRPY